MHILFFSHNFPPEVNALATRTHAHCRRWVADGHRVTVVTCAPNYPQGVVFPGYRNAWRSEEAMNGIRVVRVGTLLAPNRGFARRVLYFLSYMVRAVLFGLTVPDADIVVASSPQFFAGWAGVLCARLKRWPLVLEVRDIWPESILAVGAMKRTRLIRLLEWLERRMYRAADHIVTVGSGYRRQLLARDVPADKISIVPNGVDPVDSARSFDRLAFRKEQQVTDKFVCAYVGTVGMAHGLEVVLDAAGQLAASGRNDVQFWIVGDGAERADLEAEVERRGLTTVRFFGMVPKSRVTDFIESADAALVHLRGTGLFGTVLPSKIFEIMQAGVPIVMGVRGEALDLVVDHDAGVAMTPDDAGSLVDCIDTISANPAAYRQGNTLVADQYNRDMLARRMLVTLKQHAGATLSSADLALQSAPRQAGEYRAA